MSRYIFFEKLWFFGDQLHVTPNVPWKINEAFSARIKVRQARTLVRHSTSLYRHLLQFRLHDHANSPPSFTAKTSSFILMTASASSAGASVPALAHSLHTLMRQSCEQLANNSSPPEWIREKTWTPSRETRPFASYIIQSPLSLW